jgi:hypothetical protein
MKKIPAARDMAAPVSLRDTRDGPDDGKPAAARGLMRLTLKKMAGKTPAISISKSVTPQA